MENNAMRIAFSMKYLRGTWSGKKNVQQNMEKG